MKWVHGCARRHDHDRRFAQHRSLVAHVGGKPELGSECYALTSGGLMLVAGRVGDALGRKNVFGFGLIVFGVASLVGGLSTSGTALILARAVQGIGAAAAIPGALSLLVSTFPEGEKRTRALGVYGAATGLAYLGGLLLGGLLTTYANWRWVLFVNIPVVVAIIIGLGVLKEGERDLRVPEIASVQVTRRIGTHGGHRRAGLVGGCQADRVGLVR
jgi:MFS family permease